LDTRFKQETWVCSKVKSSKYTFKDLIWQCQLKQWFLFILNRYFSVRIKSHLHQFLFTFNKKIFYNKHQRFEQTWLLKSILYLTQIKNAKRSQKMFLFSFFVSSLLMLTQSLQKYFISNSFPELRFEYQTTGIM